jgi:hypothetical protein
MKYLVKPFRLLVGIFLVLFNCFLYAFAFICYFIWYLNPKKVYFRLRREFRYGWIYTWEDLEHGAHRNGVFYTIVRKKYYKTLLDFINNKTTYLS